MPRRVAGRALRTGARMEPDPFQLLVAEHDLLRTRLQRSQAGNGTLDALVSRVRAHLDRESLALYPLCERLFGGREGAVAVMRRDHEDLEEQLRELSVVGRSGSSLAVRIARLARRLEDHFSREERVLFPLMDALLTGTDTARLAERLSIRVKG